MMSKLRQRGLAVSNWLEHRLGLGKPIIEEAEHPIPIRSASWWYVFGSAATVLLGLQIVTGILLALVYVPSAGEAWNSLQFLNHNVTLGWLLRAIHGWGSNFMIAIVLIHMAQVFLFGAYKFPRELTWIVGVLLLLLTLGMAFSGQVLRFDQDAYWGLGIGASVMSRVPGVGALKKPRDGIGEDTCDHRQNDCANRVAGAARKMLQQPSSKSDRGENRQQAENGLGCDQMLLSAACHEIRPG